MSKDNGQDRPANSNSPFFSAILNNWYSLSGSFLALVSVLGSVTFLLLGALLHEPPAYLSMILIPLVVAAFSGATLILIGTRVARWRKARGMPPLAERIVIDLHNNRHRFLLVGVAVGMMVAFVTVVVGSVGMFEYMESNNFCGQTCHTVMSPEFTTYGYSSHARVKCVECHIGTGAEWFVRSKLSGLKQVIAVALNSFPRPIPTPIHDLRPARETCEECHWPKKFIGYKEVVRSYYRGNETNDPYHIRMLMKIGGEGDSLMKGSGIHYHMLQANKVEYIARDDKRQDIAWVRSSNQTKSVEFEDAKHPLTAEEKQTLEKRAMDCMDCHNRPSHEFHTPMHIVNQALEVGAIDGKLPFIKIRAVEALSQDYPTTTDALAGIAGKLEGFYREKYSELLRDNWLEVVKAIEEVQKIYTRSIFPEMKAKWSAYPNNRGHRDWPGCFRCHNERLVSADKKNIFTTCNKCHLILAQGKDIGKVEVDFTEGLAFLHPSDNEEINEYTDCSECHTGGASVYQ